jgi:uridine phosphorylase
MNEKDQANGPRGNAEHIQMEGGRQYHIDLAQGEVAESIILVGDPARAERVASKFESVELTRAHREYLTITGVHEGLRVSVMGTGMGAAGTEIAVVELCQLTNSPTMIRCGSTGALQADMALGDLVITQSCVRREETSLGFVEPGYPSAAHHEAVIALIRAADEQGFPFHVGVTATAPGFYGAQGRSVPGFGPRDPSIVESLVNQGVRNLEMEASCLLALASYRGFRAGAVCAVYATRHDNRFISDELRHEAEGRCIASGLRALHHVAEMDGTRGEKPHWHPGLLS